MNNRFLVTLALIGAPSLLIGHTLESIFPSLAGSSFYGAYGFIYITGWMCSIELLRRTQATGKSLFGKFIVWLILGTLFLANSSNVYAFIAPQNRSALMLTLDSFWPISNLLMLILGITVVVSKRLSGWQRFVPLFAGLWFPFAMASKVFLTGVHIPFDIVFTYSALAWTLLAFSAITSNKSDKKTSIRYAQFN
jgi:hypothetical protein